MTKLLEEFGAFYSPRTLEFYDQAVGRMVQELDALVGRARNKSAQHRNDVERRAAACAAALQEGDMTQAQQLWDAIHGIAEASAGFQHAEDALYRLLDAVGAPVPAPSSSRNGEESKPPAKRRKGYPPFESVLQAAYTVAAREEEFTSRTIARELGNPCYSTYVGQVFGCKSKKGGPPNYQAWGFELVKAGTRKMPTTYKTAQAAATK